MAIPVAFLGLFFDDLIFPLSPEFSSMLTVNNEATRIKSEDIQMLAYLALIFGCILGNERSYRKVLSQRTESKQSGNYGIFIFILTGILLLLIIYDYVTGVFSSWFYYSNAEWMDVEERNQGLGHLTCLLLSASCVEIVRVREKGVTNFLTFIKSLNKLYLFELLGISLLLYMSGNRNEMLLIILPIIVGYTLCIKKIPNKVLIIAGVLGVLLMADAGMSRQESVSLGGNTMGIYSLTRDFAGLGYNTDYLIDYTDKHGTTNFQGLPISLLSGVPYLGSLIISTTGISGPDGSATVCNDSILGTGLGTSLIGDLYYTGGFVWVVVFMLLFGYSMSRLYHSDKKINIYLLVFYCYMVANSVYYIRSSWDFPITEIEYAMIIIFLGNVIFKNMRIRKQI